jgi:ATP-dependent Zn protease
LLSQSLLDRVEEAVSDIINTQLVRAREVVGSEKESIARLVELLLAHDTVEADGIKQCFVGPDANKIDPESLTHPASTPMPQPALA